MSYKMSCNISPLREQEMTRTSRKVSGNNKNNGWLHYSLLRSIRTVASSSGFHPEEEGAELS